ncbi:Oxidoreductase NAD-binding Rossmann fold [Chlorella sorokiniana]|uniref:Oxidoreductase NAD-binding Rossmann fold n=1 Tax=Chlorella sorokiniana TaxID=3076 RepID=A0A2P6TC10_CHLSO|nr:Oxidoreductase NAD-binding Rossmann fold [Chlorella sorokiniana]|eukprot:PRW20167.1 Oxidoreductase NAD-binding Rossmann fold [Chlorella sorokiniana]
MAGDAQGSGDGIIRVGIIGAGANTKTRHIPNLQEIPGVQLVSVCNRSLASSHAAAQQFGIPHSTDNWREVVEHPEVDAVVIGTWPYMHATLTCAALEAGKNVLCEARMAMDAKEAHQMLAASRRQPRLVAQIVPSPFTLPFDATIQDILRSGKLGQLVYISVRGVARTFADPPGAPLHWRQSADYSGTNILMMGIFYEALQRWVGDATRVVALAKVVTQTRLDAEAAALTGVRVPDHVDVLADMACGAQAHMVFSAVTGAAREPASEFWLHGTEGTLHLDVDNGQLLLALKSEGGQLKPVDVPHEARGFWRVEQEFIGAIRGQERVKLTDFQTGVRYMEFTEAVTRSYQSGQAVTLPLFD